MPLQDIPVLRIKEMVIELTGETPLIVHKWAEKAKD